MSQFPNSLPGIGSSLTLTPRTLFVMDTATGDFYPGGKIIDGYSARDPGNSPVSELRMGLVVGLINATGSGGTAAVVGNWGASIIGTVTTAIAAGTITSITIGLTAATELIRRGGASGTLVLTSSPTAGGTAVSANVPYSAVSTTTGAITTTGSANGVVAGSWIGVPDGSAVPFSILCGDLYPIRVTDINGTNISVPWRYVPITNKPYLTANIVNYPAAANTGLTAYLKAKLRVAVPGAAFDDDFGS